MKSPPSALAPLLRSDTVGELLAAFYLNPGRTYTMTELAGRIGVSTATVHRELGHLTKAGLVTDATAGRTRLFTVDTQHPLHDAFLEIVTATYAPAPVLEGLLASVPGIDAAYIYGSWAARREGIEGPPPNDIDLLVLGEPDDDALASALDEAERVLGREVNVRRTTRAAWNAASDPFARTVKERPLRELNLARGSA